MLRTLTFVSCLLFGGLAAASAYLSDSEIAQARKTAVGDTLVLQQLPLTENRSGEVQMRRVDIYAEDARILVQTEDGFSELPRSQWSHFISDAEVPGSPRVGLSIDPEGKNAAGVLFTADGRAMVLRGELSEAGIELTMSDSRRGENGEPTHFQCENSRLNSVTRAPSGFQPPSETGGPRTLPILAPRGGQPAAVVAVDTDNEFMQQKFADNTTAATDYLAQLFVGLNTVYQRDLALTMVQGTTLLRVSSTPDPYTSPDSGQLLTQFGTLWQNTQGAVPRAFAMLLSGQSPNEFSSNGIAWVMDNVNYCSQTQSQGGHYSVTQVFKFNGATAQNDLLVVAHELGHNLGAEHTHCSDATTGAGPQATNTIDQCFNAEAGCFSGPEVCPVPSTVNGVPNVNGTLMSYCELGSLVNCPARPVFATAHRTLLTPRVANNAALGCFQAASGPDIIFQSNFDGEAGPSDLVTINDINFVPAADFTGGSIRWRDGSTCACDDGPYDLNIYGDTAPRFFWIDGGSGVSTNGTTYAVLSSGATVGPDSSYIIGTSTAATAPWHNPGNVDGFLGFRFTDGIVKYGYARITTGANGRPFTIVSITYNNAGAAVTIP